MMTCFSFLVNGKEVNIESVWVHFQGRHAPEAKPFVLVVPACYVTGVFDPHGNCPPNTPLEAYLTDLISEMGTFVFHGFLERLRGLRGVQAVRHEWVIASVERVEDSGTALTLAGHVVPFIPWTADKF